MVLNGAASGWTATEVAHDDLTFVAQTARVKMGKALRARFFNRYYPLLSLKNPKQLYGKHARRRGQQVHSAKVKPKFSYGFDAACALNPHPMYKEFKLVEFAIKSFLIEEYDLTGYSSDLILPELQEKHLQLIKVIVWNKIKDLAVRSCKVRIAATTPSPLQAPPSKRAKVGPSANEMDELLEMFATGDAVSASFASEHTSPETLDPQEIVQAQIDRYNSLPTSSTEISRKDSAEGSVKWWADHADLMPDLAKVATAFRGFFASSGGLECDLGAMKDVIQPKRASLNPKYVAALMALKLNRHMDPNDLADVRELGTDWDPTWRTWCI